jgi:HK97 family phage major capsid protein
MKLIDMELKMREQKDVTIGSDAGGGYAVPEQISRDIGVLEKKYSPVRDLVRVVQIGTSDYKELLTIRGATSGWVGETGSRSATGTPTIRNIVPTQGELYAYPQASEWSLDDPFFSLESWLTENVAREFALQEGSAVLTGNGTTKPTGMLNTTPVTTADYASPLRAAAAYEYVASDLTPGGSGVLADTLFDLVYKLNTSYRAAGVWIMNSTTLGAVRKLKDTTNQYLWQPGLVAGQPDRLLGYPISTWEQMSDIGANNFPVGFGDWREAYVLVDRVGLRVTRDQVTNPGYVRFYIRRRLGGIVRNNDAAKFLRTL